MRALVKRLALHIALLVALVVMGHPAQAAITKVQSQTCHGTASSVTCSFATLPAAGNQIIVAVSGLDACTMAMSDNQGGSSYLTAVNPNNAAYARWTGIWYRENISAPSGTFTVTAYCPGNSEQTVVIEEVSGLATSSSLDKTASLNPTANFCASTSATDSTTATATLSSASQFVISVYGGRNSSGAGTIAFSASGYTVDGSNTGTAYANSPAATASKIVSANTGVSITWLCNASTAGSHPASGTISLATFTAPGAGGSTPKPGFLGFF